MTDQEIVKAINAALTKDPRVNADECQLDITSKDGHIKLNGIVPSVAAKRLASLHGEKIAGVQKIENNLLVHVHEKMGEGELIDHIQRAFLQEPNIDENKIEVTADSSGRIVLRGAIHSLMEKRLCEVLCWWVPGVAAVDNQLVLEPDEKDSDPELRDNLMVILDKDPMVDAKEILIGVKDYCVILQGQVDSERSRSVIEKACWYVPGVKDVNNQLTVA